MFLEGGSLRVFYLFHTTIIFLYSMYWRHRRHWGRAIAGAIFVLVLLILVLMVDIRNFRARFMPEGIGRAQVLLDILPIC